MLRVWFRTQYFSGVLLAIFTGWPVLSQLLSVPGIGQLQSIREKAGIIQRDPFFGVILLFILGIHFRAGFRIIKSSDKHKANTWSWVRSFSGLYLGYFVLIHVCIVLASSWILEIETGFYTGVPGMNTYPLKIVFAIYYLLTAVFFAAHTASRMSNAKTEAVSARHVFPFQASGILK